jgi:membrane-bound metal-dependent hydrolase YbcI (DUF457 family)
MDPVSHAAFGRTLIACDRRGRLGAGAVAAAMLGSLAPDLDLLRAIQGWDVYLRHHQAGTHALAGALGCAALTAGLLRLFVARSRWLPLFAAASAGAFGHLLLDAISGADIRPLAPFFDANAALPLFAMADPWLLGPLVLCALVAWRVRHRLAPVILLASLAAYGAAKGTLLVRARAIDRTAPAAGGPPRYLAAGFGAWTRWTFFHADATVVEAWEVDASAGSAVRVSRVERRLAGPLVAESRALPTVHNLVETHRVTLARVHALSGGGHDVLWSDLRYCELPVTGSEPSCGLWFGGTFDAGNRAIAALVRLGSHVQRRSPGPAVGDEQ